MPLTQTEIKNAKPGDKPKRLFDGGGLLLEIAPGDGLWWRFKCRFAVKEKRLSLGVYPDVTLKDARERCDRARKTLAAGTDPRVVRKAEKLSLRQGAENSFEVVSNECSWPTMPKSGLRATGCAWSDFSSGIYTRGCNRPIADISPPELLDAIRRIESRGALETANRALGNCGQVFRYAMAAARAARDPAADLRGALPPVKGSTSQRLRSPGVSGHSSGCWTVPRAL